jgi:hypothetical protein
MNEVEDRLRTLTRALEDTFPDNGVRPLELPPADAPGQPRRRGRWQRDRVNGWLIPLAAAAAVIALVAGSLALTRDMGTAAHHPRRPAAASALATQIPPYYVLLAPDRYTALSANPRSSKGFLGAGAYALVVSSLTGQVLATVTAPTQEKVFTMVTGTADDDTFVLAASQGLQFTWGSVVTHFYLLRFQPGDRSVHLTALPSSTTTKYVTGFALSPDGSKLAVAHAPDQKGLDITVRTLATGASRTWTGPSAPYSYPDNYLSWSSDGRLLAFAWQNNVAMPMQRTGLLDTTAPGTRLPSASVIRLVTPDPPALLTPDGKLIVGWGGLIADAGIGEYSVRTHRLIRGLGPVPAPEGWRPAYFQLRWTNTTGSVVIASGLRTCALGYGHALCLPVPLVISNQLGAAW